jgi:hypothetical protein
LVVTVNFAVEDPEITVTELGTVAFALLLFNDTLVLLAAVPLKVIVQLEDAGVVTVAGLQVKLVSVMTGCVMVIEPLPPVIVMELPLASAANTPERFNAAEVSLVFAIWNVTDATLPLAMAVVFMPTTRHRTSPADRLLQVVDFPATEAAVPVV